MDWTDARLQELEGLRKLISECKSINSGNLIIERLSLIMSLAQLLDLDDPRTGRTTFYYFLKQLAVKEYDTKEPK